jgi:hypothetical protein
MTRLSARRAHGAEAVHRPGRHRAGPPHALEPGRASVGMGERWGLGVAQHVVDQREQSPEPFFRSLEHMFVMLRPGPDGLHEPLQEATARRRSPAFCEPRPAAPERSSDPRWRPIAQDPREDHTSSLVTMRSTTAEVNSVVPALPPRSGVLTPAAIVSSVAS